MQSPLSKRTTLQNKQIARRKGSVRIHLPRADHSYALHVTHTPGTPGVVVLTKSVLREVAVSQLLHPRI